MRIEESIVPEGMNLPKDWTHCERPPYLFRRFQFSSYRETRVFLDKLAALSEECGYYPDISFGTNYANITIHAQDGKAVATAEITFAQRVSELAGQTQAPD